jgi:ribulose-bisphosphate carboxylase large chain
MRSRLIRHKGGFRWKGTRELLYKPRAPHHKGVRRFPLVAGQEGLQGGCFHLRYFELCPGGYTSLEQHRHVHVIVALRGMGQAVVQGRRLELRPLDVLYIAPGESHRLQNPYQEPFGFLCIVDAQRDRPVLIQQGASCEPRGRK